MQAIRGSRFVGIVFSVLLGSGFGCALLRKAPANNDEASASKFGSCAEASAAGGNAGTRENCLAAVARRAEDPERCSQIGDPEATNACLRAIGEATGNAATCAKISVPGQRASCTSASVRNGGDPKACAALEPSAERDTCFTVGALRDPAWCQQIAADARYTCLAIVQDQLDDPGAACGESLKCLAEMGRSDVKLCERIPDSAAALRTLCLTHATTAPEWAPDSRCEPLAPGATRDECFSLLGRQPWHGDDCAKVVAPEARRSCIFQAGHIDPGYCAALAAADRTACIAASEMRTSDSSVCSALQGNAKEDCVRFTGIQLAQELMRAR